MAVKVCQGKQGKRSRCLRGTSQEFYHEHSTGAPEADVAAAAASSRRPRSSGAPRSLLQQTRSCAPAREQLSKAQEPPGQENYSTQGFQAVPLPVCATPGASARSARRGRDASRAHAHPRRVEPLASKPVKIRH